MSGTDVAADVPDKYDIVIDGYGYSTARAVDPNLPFRTQPVALSFTPTFLERTNVGSVYGDDQQAFFLTSSQKDFSLGEQQKFFHLDDAISAREVWQTSAVDVTIAGQVSLQPAVLTVTFANAPVAATGMGTGIYAASLTHLYQMDALGNITDLGLHGLGATAVYTGMVGDGTNVFMASTSAGTVGVRKWNGAAFSTFSATAADSLEYLNNTLYGFESSTGKLYSYSTAGVSTVVFQWKTADGLARSFLAFGYPRLRAFGGKLLIGLGNELWEYDGTNVSRVAQFPANFIAKDIAVVDGIAFVAGGETRYGGGLGGYRPTIYSYDGSTIELPWRAETWIDVTVSDHREARASVVGFAGGLVFNDDTTARLMFYNPATGSVSGIGAYTTSASADGVSMMAANTYITLHMRGGSSVSTFLYPRDSVTATSGYVITSLVDFGNSLTKQFRGIKVDFTAATDGNGGSVDIAYRIDDLNGSYTTLQTGAVSGTEYLLSNISGHSISIKITINKGTSTAGPVLKRTYVRGVPILQSYRMFDYILDLGGDSSDHDPVKRRDQSDHTYNGEEMRAHLTSAIQSTTPITVTDRTGTYTAILEPGNCEFDQTRPGQWYAQIRLREV